MCWLSDFNRKTFFVYFQRIPEYTVLAPPHVITRSTGAGRAGIINGFLFMAFHGCSSSPTPMTLQFKPCLFGSRVQECSLFTPFLLVLIKALNRHHQQFYSQRTIHLSVLKLMRAPAPSLSDSRCHFADFG